MMTQRCSFSSDSSNSCPAHKGRLCFVECTTFSPNWAARKSTLSEQNQMRPAAIGWP